MAKTLHKAKQILDNAGITSVTPAQLVASANELNKSLEQTLNLIAFLRSGGSGYSDFPQTAKVLTGSYS